MIHILCYLHGGGSGREGRQLWSSAWPLCLALGLTCRPARLSVWSPHPLCVVLVFSLFITLLFFFLPQHPYLYPLLPCSPVFAHLTPSLPLTLPPATRCHPPPPRLPSQALHWIFHHKPPAACQSQRTLPLEASTEGPASDIKSGIKAKKKKTDRIKMGRETTSLRVWD